MEGDCYRLGGCLAYRSRRLGLLERTRQESALDGDPQQGQVKPALVEIVQQAESPLHRFGPGLLQNQECCGIVKSIIIAYAIPSA